MKAKKSRIPVRRRQVGVLERREREGEHAGLGLVDEGQGQDPDQQEGRAQEGVEEELDRGVGPPLVAPPGDDEVGRAPGSARRRGRRRSGPARGSCPSRPPRAGASRRRRPAAWSCSARRSSTSGNSTAASRTRKMEIPSTPRYQRMPEGVPGVGVVRHQLEAAEVHLHGDEGEHGDDQGGQGDQRRRWRRLSCLGEPGRPSPRRASAAPRPRGQEDEEGQEGDAAGS